MEIIHTLPAPHEMHCVRLREKQYRRISNHTTPRKKLVPSHISCALPPERSYIITRVVGTAWTKSKQCCNRTFQFYQLFIRQSAWFGSLTNVLMYIPYRIGTGMEIEGKLLLFSSSSQKFSLELEEKTSAFSKYSTHTQSSNRYRCTASTAYKPYWPGHDRCNYFNMPANSRAGTWQRHSVLLGESLRKRF